MAALTSQTIANSFEQLLHTDVDGGLSTSLVPIKDGDSNVTSALLLAQDKVEVKPSDSSGNSTTTFEVSQYDGTPILTINSTTPGATITGTATITGNVDITATTAATDATGDTGALRCEGGASIADDIYVGEHVYLANTKKVYFGADDDTYIYASADDVLELIASTERRLVINSSGVGFGKVPSFKMAISFATNDIDIKDAGTGSATEAGWIQVAIGGGSDSYIRTYSSK